MKRLSQRDDRGASLIELLVAMAIMGTAVVALLGAIAASVRLSDVHRHQATAGAYIKEFAEKVEKKVAEQPTGYLPCVAGSSGDDSQVNRYLSVFQIPVADQGTYTREVTEVRFWNVASSSWQPDCPGTGDYGVQLVSLVVRFADGGRATVTERMDVTIRQPCRAVGDPICV